MLPNLKVLDVRWGGSALTVRTLMERCTSLEQLHMDVFMLDPNNRSATVSSASPPVHDIRLTYKRIR